MFELGRVFGDIAQQTGKSDFDLTRAFLPKNSGMDQVAQKATRKVAKVITSKPTSVGQQALIRKPPKSFWQIAPDGKTIERTYSTEDEPIFEVPDNG